MPLPGVDSIEERAADLPLPFPYQGNQLADFFIAIVFVPGAPDIANTISACRFVSFIVRLMPACPTSATNSGVMLPQTGY